MKKNGFLLVLVLAFLTACQSPLPATTLQPSALVIASAAFANGEAIPVKHTCNVQSPPVIEGVASPPLSWSGVPEGTESLALIMDDPDAPLGTFIHWVIYNLSASSKGLPEGVPQEPALADGSRQGINNFSKIGYGPPCPPPGSLHRYFFRLYALDTVLDLEPGSTAAQLQSAMEVHILAQAELIGIYAAQ